ncbi:MAG: lasso RiPP family leader peptide-containing protein [Pseudonocardiaceae bacterium]
MLLPYEPPEITLLGSVRELTQADFFHPGSDFTLLGIPLGGEDGSVFS